MGVSSEQAELHRILDTVGDELAAWPGVVGYGVGVAGSKAVVQIFTDRALSDSAARELDRLFGDRYTVVRTGPFESQ